MAPKKMPKPKPTTDPVDRLLQERELDYQGAMGITNNDLRAREAELLQIQKAYADSGLKVEGFEEFLTNKHAEIKRAFRDLISEQSYLFEDDARNYAIGGGNLLDINKTEAKQRQISQPIPGTQAHHPASVSSVESYLRDMPMAEQRRALDLLVEQGYTVGSRAKGFIPLSGPAHLGGGEKWGRDFAHVGKEGVEVDPGRFKGPTLPKNTRAEDAVRMMKPMLDEQIALNTAAYNHPVERKMRATAERLLGKPVTWIGGDTPDVQAQNKAAKAMGVNATTVSKGFSRYPGLMDSGKVPGVDVMTDVGARIPLGTKPSDAVRRQATAIVRNPSVALGQRAAAIVNREPLPQPKPQPKPAPKPAPKPQPKVRVGTGRWAAAASRPPSSSASAGRRSLTIGQNPLSPLNRGSAASGAIERSTNDAIQDAPGWSPFWLKLAD